MDTQTPAGKQATLCVISEKARYASRNIRSIFYYLNTIYYRNRFVYLARYVYQIPTSSSSNSVVVGSIGGYIICQAHIPDKVAYPIIVLDVPVGF